MPTTTNYGWTTPADTDLVKDGASAIRTLGTAADTTVKNLNPGTTAGDVDYYTSGTAKARLAIGTAGQFLAVNSGATAPEWQTLNTNKNYSLLNSGGTALTGAATVTVSGISGKDKIIVILENASSASASSVISIRLNTDTGNNYNWSGNFLTIGSTYSAANFVGERNFSVSSFPMGRMSTSTGSNVYGTLILDGCNSAGTKMATLLGGGEGSDSQRLYNYGGFYSSASTISSVSAFSSVGNFDGGTIYVYATA